MSTKTAKKRHRSSASRPARPRPATDAHTAPAAARKRKPAPSRRRRRFDPTWGQIAVVGALLAVGGLFYLSSRAASGGVVKQPTAAPAFTMPSTAGGDVSLSDLAGHNVLLYFNEGVGCDACFYQTLELEKAGDELAQKDITLLPIVMNPVEDVQGQLDRFGITTPYLVDVDGSVSKAFGVLGKGMHADLPGHGFIFIDATGQIRWEKEYPSMYAAASEVLGAVGRFVA